MVLQPLVTTLSLSRSPEKKSEAGRETRTVPRLDGEPGSEHGCGGGRRGAAALLESGAAEGQGKWSRRKGDFETRGALF